MPEPSSVTAMEKERRLLKYGFTEILLAGIILLAITCIVLAIGLYSMPSASLEVPELQPVIRVAREADFPVGSSRIRNWGDRAVLVIRPDSLRYSALQGTSPSDGCILRWDRDALRVYSPCSFEVYNLQGAVVTGLTTKALKQYAVSIRDGVIYVSEGT